jgi:hypothetical protein
MYMLGKSLQALGLVVPLVGFFRAISEGGDARGMAMTELAMLAGGVLLFLIGTALVRKAGGG